MLRIIAIDRHLATRQGLGEILTAEEGIRVVGQTGDGDEALRLVEEFRPDLVVLDLNLVGKTGGTELCRRIKDLPEAPYVLVHTAYDIRDVSNCLLAGADGLLRKSAGREELLDAVRRTAAGEQVWNLGEQVGKGAYIRALQEGRLTPREREVFSLLAHRYTNAEIAERLHIGYQTTKNHVSSILRKLNLKSRKDLHRLLEEDR